MKKTCFLILFGSLANLLFAQADSSQYKLQSAFNDSIIRKYDLRMNTIDRNNFLLNSYNFFIDDVIQTQCTQIQRRLFNNFHSKWREIMYDYEALSELPELKEIDDKSKNLNVYISEIKRRITLFASSIGLYRNTQIDDKNHVLVKSYLEKIKDNSQMIVNLDIQINRFKSTKN